MEADRQGPSQEPAAATPAPAGSDHLDADAEAQEDPVHAGDARHQQEQHEQAQHEQAQHEQAQQQRSAAD